MTPSATGALITCLENELAALDAHHHRIWKAASEATGRELVTEDAKLQ